MMQFWKWKSMPRSTAAFLVTGVWTLYCTCPVMAEDGNNNTTFEEIITRTCESSEGCSGDNSYCASGVCREIGKCSVREDCFNPDNSPYPSLYCEGYMSCSENSFCTMICGAERCPNGQDFVPCDENSDNLPCDVQICDEAASCYIEQCGGCRAVFFDRAGNQVCKTEKDYSQEETIESCASKSDCNVTEYCAAGSCLEVSACNHRMDCINPANFPFAAFTCIGFLECYQGYCQMHCGDSLCPDGKETLECDPKPCDSEKCPEAVACYNDFCGACTAVFFDPAGVEVCKQDEVKAETQDDTPTQLMLCNNGEDCAVADVERFIEGDYYCARGVCKEMGTCEVDTDCNNPKNAHRTIHCLGYNTCNNGICDQTCGSACKDGSIQEECEPGPCDVAPACTGAVSCLDDHCNGCNAVYFDEAGNVMDSCGESDAESDLQNSDVAKNDASTIMSNGAFGARSCGGCVIAVMASLLLR